MRLPNLFQRPFMTQDTTEYDYVLQKRDEHIGFSAEDHRDELMAAQNATYIMHERVKARHGPDSAFAAMLLESSRFFHEVIRADMVRQHEDAPPMYGQVADLYIGAMATAFFAFDDEGDWSDMESAARLLSKVCLELFEEYGRARKGEEDGDYVEHNYEP